MAIRQFFVLSPKILSCNPNIQDGKPIDSLAHVPMKYLIGGIKIILVFFLCSMLYW